MRIWSISKVREAFSNIKTELEQQQQRQAQLDNKQEQIDTRQTQLEKTAQQLESELQKTQQELVRCQKMIEDCRQEAQQKSEQLAVKNKELEDWKDTFSGNNWRMMYSYDNMVAQLQLDAIEQRLPGNRQRLSSLKDTHVGESCFDRKWAQPCGRRSYKIGAGQYFFFGVKKNQCDFPRDGMAA